MDELLQKAVVQIVNPIIQVLFAVALVMFVYGIFEFIRGADQPEVRTTGQKHMLWGIVGLFIMISVFTIIRILLNTLGITGSEVPEILPR
jgi:hypothetical protein